MNSQCAPKILYENHRIWKKWPLFKFGKKNLCVQKKKFCNQNQYLKKIKILFSGSGLHYWITRKHNNPEFQLPTFFHQFSYFVKNQKNFLSKCQNIKKKWKKHSQPCVYIKKEEKRNQKNFYCSCCCNLTKKTLSKTLYV